MTDTAFYADMDALATELLTDFGSPATYRFFPPKPKPNDQGVVVTPAPIDTAGLAVRTSSEQVLNMFEKRGSAVLAVKFPTATVGVENQIIHAGRTWKIQEAKVISPVGAMIVAFVSCVEP